MSWNGRAVVGAAVFWAWGASLGAASSERADAWAREAMVLRDRVDEVLAAGDGGRGEWAGDLYRARVLAWWASDEGTLAAEYMLARFPEKTAAAGKIGDLAAFLTSERYQNSLRSHDGEGMYVDEVVWPRRGPLGGRLSAAGADRLLASPELLEEVAIGARASDYQPAVWRILGELTEEEGSAAARFPGLAAALGMVYDEPVPATWPHCQVAQGAVPQAERPWTGILRDLAGAQRRGALLNDLRSAGAASLKFVVDAPLATEEWAWARANVNLPRHELGAAYDMVPYDARRAARGGDLWTRGPYRLRAIREAGGICSDQAYFAAVAGKALGVPTVMIVAQGTDAGHGWFGYQNARGAWVMGQGKDPRRTYGAGRVVDPQDWREIGEDEVADQVRQSPERQRARQLLVLASLYGEIPSKQAALVGRAVGLDEASPDIWRRGAEWLAGSRNPAAASHLEAMAKRFRGRPEASAWALQRLACLADARGDAGEAVRTERLIFEQNRVRRPDLAAAAAGRAMQRHLALPRPEFAQRDYRRYLEGLAGRAGRADATYRLVRPTVLGLAQRGLVGDARRALAIAREVLDLETDTQLSRSLDPLEHALPRPLRVR